MAPETYKGDTSDVLKLTPVTYKGDAGEMRW